MNITRKDNIARIPLSEVIPLRTPYKMNIDVANACNFKCKFCFHALDDLELNRVGFNSGIMNFELFTMIVDQIKEFPDRIKCIGLSGIGEPLLNKKLPDMIALVKESNIADKIVVTTNGSFLNEELIIDLVNSGLDEMIISVEALSEEKYFDVTGVHIDFERFIENIAFLNEHKRNCKIYIKIVDIAFDENDTEEKFHLMFDDKCDMAYVEQIIPQFDPIDYSKIKTEYDKTLYGKKLIRAEVCPLVFYVMQITTSGNVSPCCVDYNESVVFGNVKNQSLINIWNNETFNNFRLMQLKKQRFDNILCKSCSYTSYNAREEDIIDRDADKLIKYF